MYSHGEYDGGYEAVKVLLERNALCSISFEIETSRQLIKGISVYVDCVRTSYFVSLN